MRDRLVERGYVQTVPSCRKKLVRFTTCHGVFDWPYALQRHVVARNLRDVQGALEAMGLNLEELIDEEMTRASVTVVWAVWRLASSIPGDVRVAGARLRHPL